LDFRVTDDQAALREGIADFCERRLPFESLLALCDKPLDRALWSEVAKLGVFSLRLPESDGGLGLGMAEAVLVFAELGSRLVPGPLIWSALVAPLLQGVEEGGRVATGLDRVQPSSDPMLVEHLEGSDTLIVLEPAGVRVIETAALQATPIKTPLDPLTPVHLVETLPKGEVIGGAEMATRLRTEGALLASAMQLGICEATLEHATDYALKREQFNRPIGSFQAIKHFLADMLVRKEQAKAAVYAAAATADGRGVDEPERAIAVAKLIAGEAAHKNARQCIQIYGGMGYVWEMAPHLYLKRELILETIFGTTPEHATNVAHHLATRAAS
jgi:alkylation response protein AidB-like acyl-CoA dehydrogenase